MYSKHLLYKLENFNFLVCAMAVQIIQSLYRSPSILGCLSLLIRYFSKLIIFVLRESVVARDIGAGSVMESVGQIS